MQIKKKLHNFLVGANTINTIVLKIAFWTFSILFNDGELHPKQLFHNTF